MQNKVMIGKYYPVKSLIHKMNPLAKILCTFLFVAICFFANTIRFNLLASILLFLIILSTNIPLKLYFKMIFSLKWIFILIFVILYLTNIDLELIAVILFRILYVILYSSVLTLTTPPNELNTGLIKFFSPLRIFFLPINQIALSITLALRFIPTMMDTASRINKTQTSRGIEYRTSGLIKRFVAIKSRIIPILTLSFKKADNMAMSMEARLYDNNRKRMNFRQNKWGIYDTFLVALHISLIVLIVRGII